MPPRKRGGARQNFFVAQLSRVSRTKTVRDTTGCPTECVSRTHTLGRARLWRTPLCRAVSVLPPCEKLMSLHLGQVPFPQGGGVCSPQREDDDATRPKGNASWSDRDDIIEYDIFRLTEHMSAEVRDIVEGELEPLRPHLVDVICRTQRTSIGAHAAVYAPVVGSWVRRKPSKIACVMSHRRSG